MKKKILVQDLGGENNLFEVAYSRDGREINIIYHPKDKKWTRPGTVTASLKDNTNGFNIILEHGPYEPVTEHEFDYASADMLRVLLGVNAALYRKSRGKNIKGDVFINDLSELETRLRREDNATIQPFGDLISELEEVIQKMVDQHDLQFGDILSIVHGYLCVHNPEAREEYVDGSGSPTFYYGSKEGLK
jgi:hypothetical protein